MEAVRHHITQRKARLARHPLFERIQGTEATEHVVTLGSALGFWGRALRDVLAAYAERAGGGAEDDARGFFEVVERLMGSRLPPVLVAGDAHPLTREGSYQLLYEVLASKTDGVRRVLLEAIDAAQEIFAHHVGGGGAPCVEETRVESFAVALAADDEQEAIAAVERVFAAFDRMFDGFVAMRA